MRSFFYLLTTATAASLVNAFSFPASSLVSTRITTAPPLFGLTHPLSLSTPSCCDYHRSRLPRGKITVIPPLFGIRSLTSGGERRRRAASASGRLFMGWGPEPTWTTATVTSNTQACPSGKCIYLNAQVLPEVASEYKIPGQFVQVKPPVDTGEDFKPIFLAIASPPPPPSSSSQEEEEKKEEEQEPNSTEFEFLIKKTDNTEWITSAKPGSTFLISQIMGSGFPMQDNLEGFKYDFPTQNVLLFAAGTGIAPIRAAIESDRLQVAKPGLGGRTARLYYGVHTPDDMPYVERFATWEASGIEVVPVISAPEECEEVWQGRTGYVQNALEEDGVPIPRNSGALLCGMKGMVDAVKDLLTKAGVFEGRVLTNF